MYLLTIILTLAQQVLDVKMLIILVTFFYGFLTFFLFSQRL